MNIKILSDSTCDLSPAQLAALDISLVRRHLHPCGRRRRALLHRR